jgi:hypothetical protein
LDQGAGIESFVVQNEQPIIGNLKILNDLIPGIRKI